MRTLFILFALIAMPAFACQMHKDEIIIKADLKNPDATCGKLLYFDFGSGGHGPAYYTNKRGKIIEECGGGQHQADPAEKSTEETAYCPPKAWTCEEPAAQGADEHTPRVNAKKPELK